MSYGLCFVVNDMLLIYVACQLSICVRNTSLNSISTLDDTTASVLALPTSTEPPYTV